MVHFNRFFNEWLFFKVIKKCQTEILKCVPPSSHVCVFLIFSIKLFAHCYIKPKYKKFN